MAFLSSFIMKVSLQNKYTSVACNRSPEIVDWNSDGLLCFGACNAIAIYDTKIKGCDAHTMLSHHRARVNCVKWLHKNDGSSTELVSCSADKTAAIWSFEDGEWKLTSKLIGHANAITCINGLYVANEILTVYSASVDSSIRVWERKKGEEAILKQSINLNSGLCLTLHAYLLPIVNKPVLFCALDDHKIHVFVENEEYHRVHMLVGHEDWVRGLDCLRVDKNTILLASSSQDTYIRLWRIQKHEDQQQPQIGIKAEEKVFQGYGEQWSVKLDTVLAGHEGWVYGVQWHRFKIDNESKECQPVFRLLSSSLDKTLIIWEPDGAPRQGEGEGAWVEKVRVGEVGGNGLGFYGSRFGPDGQSILGHGYNGSFHIWSLDKISNQWKPQVVPGGHFGSVEEVRWEPSHGLYLASVSADQTTRIHAPWKRSDGLGTEWHELARPQVHGYDMSSLALISSVVFASTAEEKVVRVFKAPANFISNFENVVGIALKDAVNGNEKQGPEGATVPSLGLSNKAVFTGDQQDTDEENDGYFVPVQLTEPPTEEHLVQQSLWPETHKLYAHGHEVRAAAAAADRRLLATAARAATSEHAAVVLWDTKNWEEIQKLVSHQLTVTQLEFSPDSQRLLTVSRDRRWTVFQRREGSDLFDLAASTDKTNGIHTRIIWCCAWAHDGAMFATGSREGKLCVWTKTDSDTSTSLGPYSVYRKPLEVPNSSVTAVAFAPLIKDGARIIVTGFESGVIKIYSFAEEWSLLKELDNSAAHHLTVKRLQFKPSSSNAADMMLASCGSDHMVRIYAVTVV